MKFTIDGREIDFENPLVGEIVEAEKSLGLNMDAGTGASFAVMLFVALRREDKAKAAKDGTHPMPLPLLADEVMRADMSAVENEDEEDEEGHPPAVAADAAANGQAPEPSEISGPPPSVRSA